MTDKNGRVWTADELKAELIYLASAIVNDWEEDLANSLATIERSFDLLTEEGD